MVQFVPVPAASAAIVSAYVVTMSHSSPEMLLKLLAMSLAYAGWLLLPTNHANLGDFRSKNANLFVETSDLKDHVDFVTRSPVVEAHRDVTLEETLIEEKVVNGTLMRTCSKRLTTVMCPPEENEKHIQRFLNNDTNMLDMVAAAPAEPTPVLVKSSSLVRSASVPISPKEKLGKASLPVEKIGKNEKNEEKKLLSDAKPKTVPQVVVPVLTWVAEKTWSTLSESILTIAVWSFCGILWNSANNFNPEATFWTLFWKKLQNEYDYT
ncbi:hypothetical protein THRCLA_09708 [Thraustotheca clavata]|uniref:Uncharacterized protein n=1 Tax=Thraustotheca clavata TaxID=74557 RepID=A0A1V9YUQ2_9STRA|nr:hypothetical protein THRCLA_09708 [Thraustotheca clavata]